MFATIRGGGFFLALALITSTALGDLRPPGGGAGGARRPPEPKDYPFIVEVKEELDIPRLEIPAKFLNDARKVSAVSPTQTIMVGLAGSLAVVGLFFAVRGKPKLRAPAAAITGVTATLAIIGSLSADVRPPRQIVDKKNQITLVVFQDEDAIYLSVPKNWRAGQ